MSSSLKLFLTSVITILFPMTIITMMFWFLVLRNMTLTLASCPKKSSLLEHGTYQFKHVDTNQIYQILRNMNDTKATGYDRIRCKLLKIGAYSLSEILCKLINISTSECKFPDKLKLVELSVLLKKIDRLCKENYRHVSILTTLPKVFERSHSNQLSPYFRDIFSKFLSELGKDTAAKLRYWEW